MNKIKNILLVLLEVILTIGISGAYKLNASEVTYDKKNSTLESNTVSGAVNELGILATTSMSEVKTKLDNIEQSINNIESKLDGNISFTNEPVIKKFMNNRGTATEYSHTYLYLDTKDKNTLTIGSFITNSVYSPLYILGTNDNWTTSSWILNINSSFGSPKSFDVSSYDEVYLDLFNTYVGSMWVENITLE